VSDEYLVALGLDGEPRSRPLAFLETVNQRIHLRMEGQSHPTYFDRYLDHAIVSRPHCAPHYPHLTALKKELQSWFFYYFEPRERMRAPTSVKEVRHIGSMGEELAAFLNTLNSLDPRQFAAVEKALCSDLGEARFQKVQNSRLGLWPREDVPLWGSLASCVPVANRHARRLPVAAQDAILPHMNRTFPPGRRPRRPIAGVTSPNPVDAPRSYVGFYSISVKSAHCTAPRAFAPSRAL